MLKNKIVFITGASSGIGAACARQFAQSGAKLILCARRIEKLQELANQLKHEHNAEAHIFKLDVTQHAEVKATIHALPEAWQQIDILINNAGLAIGLETIQEGRVQIGKR